ncbi:hypothetical protein [Sphingobium sp. LSP13-1-1.1]|uniref:hypothetical protein n=1 Tax=Sphingobium sp. LSP13-1-1.1 TaxID=3135234 RepID=UPI00341655DD
MGKHVNIAPIAPRLVDEETAAAYLGRGRTRFREQVKAHQLPGPADRNGNVDLWDLRALDRYVDQRSGIRSSLGEWD